MLEAGGHLADEEAGDGGPARARPCSKPLLLEGEPGVGKTEIAPALSSALGRDLIRLQCYEGIDAAQALYEWNHAKQLLACPRRWREGRRRRSSSTNASWSSGRC